jgi:hypothetical protein
MRVLKPSKKTSGLKKAYEFRRDPKSQVLENFLMAPKVNYFKEYS